MSASPTHDEGLDGMLRQLWDHLRQGDHTGARIAGKKATRRFPGSAQAWLLRGEALRLSEAYVEAVTAYQRSVAIDPGLLIAHDRLAWLHLRNEAFAEAAQHHCVLLEHGEDIPYRILTEACDCFEKALRGATQNADRQKLARGVDLLLQRYWPAVKSSQETEEKYTALCRIGRLCALVKDYSRAAEAFSQAVDLDDRPVAARVGLADNLYVLGRDAEAAHHLREAVRNNGDDPSLKRLLDRILARQGVKSARVIAFYLPQYHPIRENDSWWGRGFTDWSNVAAAQPLWPGHLQPRQPTALGYYDLRLPASANQQFEMARKYGVDAFCYYYYWFNGRRLLEKPLNDLVEGRSGPFPFCICWVNEEWRRSWDGLSGDVLVPMEHTPESDLAFIKDVVPLLKHPDYVRVDGKPLLLVYRAAGLAQPAETAAKWKAYCRDNGIEDIHLCAMQTFGFRDPTAVGFDAAVEFPPHAPSLNLPELDFHRESTPPADMHPQFQGKIFDYQHLAQCFMRRPPEDYPLHRTCMLAWDNTARRGNDAHVYGHFTVAKYEEWLTVNVAKSVAERADAVVFVNAWNEWAEGSALEPDRFFGYELLESTRRAKDRGLYAAFGTYWADGEPQFPAARIEQTQRIVLVGHDAHRHGAQLNLLNMARSLRRILAMDVIIILLAGGELVREYERVGTTLVLESGEGWRDQLGAYLSYYAAMGAAKAVCNTVVTGEAVQVLKECGYRVCGLVHELLSLIGARGWEEQSRAMAAGSDALVFASKIVKAAFSERYQPDPSKLLVATQGVAFSPYWSKRESLRLDLRQELSWPRETRIVLGCGYGDVRKGIDLFVQVAAELTRRLPAANVAFLWVGDVDQGLAQYIAEDIRRVGLSAKLHITGKVSDPAHYFIGCDVFALTSREDPFPSVVMEAFEAGMPVVAFDGAGGYVDIVNDESGALVPYLDVSAFTRALAELLEDDERRAAIGNRNHAYSQEHFGYELYLRKLLALLDRVPASAVARGQLTTTPRSELSVSVVVPSYNYGRYLELRLRTIFDQTLRPKEIIILDDASTDYSLEIIEAMAARSPVACRLIRQDRNSGNPFAQWAAGLQAASGDLVWIAEADDYCEPMFLERLAALFDDPEVALAFSDSVMVDARGGSAGYRYRDYHRTMHGHRFDASFTMPGTELLNECLLVNNVIPNASAAVFLREAMLENLAELADYRFSGDWWFWINIAQKGWVAYLAEPLNYHRRHDQSVMGEVLQQPEKLLSETMAFYKRILARKGDIVEAQAAQAMLARLRSMFNDYRDRLQAENIDAHPELGPPFAELLRQVADLSEPRVVASAPVFGSDIELIRAEAIDAIHALSKDSELTACADWHAFFANIGERRYQEAAALYEAFSVRRDDSASAALAAILVNLWHAKYEDARTLARRIGSRSALDRLALGKTLELIDFAAQAEATFGNSTLESARPRVPEKCRFVVFHEMRVGSSLVVASLNQHEKIICYPEILVADQGGERQKILLSSIASGGLPEVHAVYAVAPKYHPLNPYRKTRIEALGFKTRLCAVLDHSGLVNTLVEGNFKIVRLKRLNTLKQAISYLSAQRLFARRGQWNLRTGADEGGGKLRADVTELMEQLDWLQKETEATDRFVEALALPTLVLSYEQLAADSAQALKRLGTFLGVEGVTPSAAFSKATDDRLQHAVENWQEVRAALGDTPWERFAVDDGGHRERTPAGLARANSG